MATIKHACEMNDVILNWKKLRKFIKSKKTDKKNVHKYITDRVLIII